MGVLMVVGAGSGSLGPLSQGRVRVTSGPHDDDQTRGMQVAQRG